MSLFPMNEWGKGGRILLVSVGSRVLMLYEAL